MSGQVIEPGGPWRRHVWALIALTLAGLAAACTSPTLDSRLPDAMAVDLSAKHTGSISRGTNPKNPGNGKGTYEIYPGQSPTQEETAPATGVSGIERNGDKFSINVDNADVAQVAKLILGDTLGQNYIIDPRVQGTITLSSARPVTAREVLDAFEAALKLNGAALLRADDFYKVVPLQEVLEGEMGTAEFAGAGRQTSPGYGVSVLPLRYVSPATMLELLDSFIARSGSVRASNIGNLVLVRGSAYERQSLVDVALSFDVDWMRNQTASIAILANSTPGEIVPKLQAIFAQDSAVSGGNGIRIIALERLNGLVLIANSQEKVRRALTWIGRLDRESTIETHYYVYAVQNGSATDLAKVLNATFLEKSGEQDLSSQVEPGQDATTVTTEGQPADQGQATDQQQAGGQTNPAGKTDRQDAQPADQQTSDTSKTAPKIDLAAGLRIVPNTANNTLAIRATPRDYRRILEMLKQIDRPAAQVLINTTIAEVVLNDQLRYGVQAFLKNSHVAGGVFNGTSLSLSPQLPGLNFILGKIGDPHLVIDALSGVTKVKIVSSPSIVVLENESATIKVGDSVPIKKEELQTPSSSGDSFITSNTFEYRDTGVILKVKPRINAAGHVTMQIAQELSAVSPSTTTDSDTNLPTISQRTINSTISVDNTQTVVLGGLISGQESRERNSVPILNKVPLVGDTVGSTDNNTKRTELIVFITPTIIRDGEDASQVSEELRDKMRLFDWN